MARSRRAALPGTMSAGALGLHLFGTRGIHLLGLHHLPETPESLGARAVDAGGVCGDEER